MCKQNQTIEYERCLICKKVLESEINIINILIQPKYICWQCYNQFLVLNQKERFQGYPITYLYQYNDFMKQIIYQYKGLYDVALAHIFLEKHKQQFKKYKNYVVVYAPSSNEDDEKRGFNHVKEIARTTGLEVVDCFYKKYVYKQSDQKFQDRKKISDVIGIRNQEKIVNKKVLLIDDVYTSGSTIATCLSLLREIKLKKIEVLIVAKR